MNRHFRIVGFMIASFGLAGGLSAGGEPDDVTARNPLVPPLFSIDRESPEVVSGLLYAADLLLPGPGSGVPAVVIPAEFMSLTPLDDLDAVSFFAWEGCTTTEFALIFSVDRDAMGAEPPDSDLVALGFPFNVQDQALKNQVAGDAFMGLLLFTRQGPIPVYRGSQSYNNTLVVNQGDAGGVHFQVEPDGESPSTPLPPGSESSVDAGGGAASRGAATLGGGAVTEVLFSLTSDSPSLATLPGTPSGANIYVDRNPQLPGEEELYVVYLQLGLRIGDDIDAMIVIDADTPFSFNPGVDQVIFSLTPESPSLSTTYGPGDLFISSGNGFFNLFCPADYLGLFSTDNIDLIDFVMCEDILGCVNQWAIGFVHTPCPGDVDGDRDVDIADLAALLAVYGSCAGDPNFLPEADFDDSGCVQLSDLATLLAHYGEVCPPLITSITG